MQDESNVDVNGNVYIPAGPTNTEPNVTTTEEVVDGQVVVEETIAE